MIIGEDEIKAAGFRSKVSFDQAITNHIKAQQMHSLTTGEPAPTANPLVERVARNSGKYQYKEVQ